MQNYARCKNMAEENTTLHEGDVDYKQKMPFIKAGVAAKDGDRLLWYGMPKVQLNFFRTFKQLGALFRVGSSIEKKDIIVRDARSRQNLKYEETGFCLKSLHSKVKDWEQVVTEGTEQRKSI